MVHADAPLQEEASMSILPEFAKALSLGRASHLVEQVVSRFRQI
jgi:hypothetical protein